MKEPLQRGKECSLFLHQDGFTLVEMIVAFALFSTLMAIGLRAWSQFGGRAAENLAQRLLLQIEARKALVSLYRELQEGVEVVSPVPGSSLPYLVFKDSVNDLRMVYLADDPMETKKEGEPIFRMMIIRREVGKPSCDDPKTLMEHVKKIEFTTFHPGAVLVSGNLRGGRGEFPFVNFVRLQNSLSEDQR